MTGKTHLAGGVAAAVVLERTAYIAQWSHLSPAPDRQVSLLGMTIPFVLLAFLTASIASLLPDLDEPNSLVSNLPRASRGIVRKTFRTRGIEGILRSLVEFGLLSINFLTRALSRLVRMAAFGHRGATHWLVTAFVLGLSAAVSGWFIGFPALGVWLFVGYISHLALDGMTLSGLELLQPFTDRKIHLLPKPMRIRTGSAVDSLLTVFFGVIAVTFVYSSMATALGMDNLRQLWQFLVGPIPGL